MRSQTALVPKSISSAAASSALRVICCWHLTRALAHHPWRRLTGIGGALFSPSTQALLARRVRIARLKVNAAVQSGFALFAVCGELGAVLGPVVRRYSWGQRFRRWRWRGRGPSSSR